MFGDRIRETTTTTGTSTITLAGAVAQYQTVASRVRVGDQFDYVLLDANGTGFETGEGTLATSTTMSRDTVYQSSNSDGLITLSTGTHKLLGTYTAQSANKRMVFGDAFIDYIVQGLVLPTTSGTLAGTLSAGIAYVIGQRVVKGAQANTYTASRDTYVDLSNTGLLTYAAVTNGAGAPALTANSIRLGKVVTSGSAITSAVQGAKDSIGNWMGNTVRVPYCDLFSATGGTLTSAATADMAFGSSTTNFDNQNLHSESISNTRITVITTGLYSIAASVQMTNVVAASGQNFYFSPKKNGSAIVGAGQYLTCTQGSYPIITTGCSELLTAGTYITCNINNGGASTETYANCALTLARLG